MTRIYLLLPLILLAGCGPARTSPVTGVVLLDGQPLANASIQFVPAEAGRDATGTTNERGEFTMSTFEPKDGVAPGSYKVVISPPAGAVDPTKYASAGDAMSAAAQARPAAQSTFPKKYTNPTLTPFTQQVPIGKEPLKFELKSE